MKLVYSTFPTHEEAIETARTLLAENLVACANILPGAVSLYKWQGKTEQQSEAIMFAKTSAEKTTTIIERIKKMHSYDTPCVLILPVETGLPEFMDWVDSES